MTEKVEGPIRVLLADPSEFTLIGMRQVLQREPGIEVIGTATDGDQLLARTTELEPDVVITEVDLPRLSGDKAAQRMRRELPSVQVVILTSRDEEQLLFDAIRAGAAAYLKKDCPPEELVDAVRRVHAGEFLINERVFARPAVASRVLAEFRRPASCRP
ncbi:MAG: response regulator transcription factor [Chloroflexi bacterium]|nr:response regulator transcription factor [Chloroflexota bacterium]